MLFLLFVIFLVILLPPFVAIFHLVLLIKLLLMNQTEAKRTRRKERAIRCVIRMGIALLVWYGVFQDEDLSLILSGMNIPVLLLYGLFLFVLPAALVVWFCMIVNRFHRTAKDDTELRRRKIWLIVSACITWTVVPAEIVLAYIPLMDMSLM